MLSEEFMDMYYGPASQAFIEKYELACPSDPMWVDYARLELVFSTSKNIDGSIVYITANGKKEPKIDLGKRRAADACVQHINTNRGKYVDNILYVCFVDVLYAAAGLKSTPEVKLLASIIESNMLQAHSRTFEEKIIHKGNAIAKKIDPTNLTEVMNAEVVFGDVIKSLVKISMDPIVQLQSQVDAMSNILKEKVKEITVHTKASDMAIGLYRNCIRSLSDGKFIQYHIQALSFTDFFSHYVPVQKLPIDAIDVCIEFLPKRTKDMPEDEMLSIYIYSSTNDPVIETLFSKNIYSINQVIIDCVDSKITDNIGKYGLMWKYSRKDYIDILKLRDDAFMSSFSYSHIKKYVHILEGYDKENDDTDTIKQI